MATKKITDLTELSAQPASNDVVAIVDIDADVTKKITISNLQSGVQSFPFTGDAEITGSLLLSGSLQLDYNGEGNIIIGSGSGGSLITGGTNNIIFGNNAATSLTTGDNNLIIGHQAGKSTALNIESRNTLIGIGAGEDGIYQTNYGDNTFIGYNAGKGSKAQLSAFVGSGVGQGTTSFSVGMGANGTLSCTAAHSVAIGYNNQSNGTNNYNVSLGSFALKAGSTGAINEYNVAIGYQAQFTSYRNNNTVSIGAKAAYGASNTQDDIFIGYESAYSYGGNTTGRNLVIGYQAGYDLGDTSAHNILIGQGVGAENVVLNNQLKIGSGSLITISGSLETGDVIFYNTASAPNFSGSFQGDGSQLTGISAGTNLTQSIFVTQNGDDTTGTIGNMSKPFATLESASQAAITGSTIFVYPGTYTLGTDNLAREGVDYYFFPNTTVNQSNSANIFDQNGFNLACNIYGSANFNITSTGGLVYFGPTNGFRDYDFTFQAQDINYSTGTAFSGMPKSNRIFSIDIRHSSGSGRFYYAPGNKLGSGRIDIKADTIESGNSNAFNTGGGIDSIRIKANRIYTPNAVSIRTYNSSLDADVQYAVGDTYAYSFTDTHGGINTIRGYANGINHANPSKTVFNGIVGKLDISNGEFHGGVANNGSITGGESSFKWHVNYTDTFSISGGVTSIELADSAQYMGQLSVSGTAKVIVTGYKQGTNSNFRYSISGGELIYKAHTLYPYNDNGANYAFDLSGGLLRMQGYIKNQLTDSDAQPQQSSCIRYRGGELILDGATLIASSSVAPAIWVTDQTREVKIYSGGVNTNKTGSMGLLAASSSFGSGAYALTNPLGGMIIEDASVE